jgi:Protein of unknown function (DUF3795)
MSDKALVGRCGTFCGSCPIHRAGMDGDEKKIFELSFSTRCTLDMVRCGGCGTSDRFVLSNNCIFRKCAKGRDLESCSFCNDFPCDTLMGLYEDDTRSKGEAEKNARRIREIGVERWLEEADARWRCQHCGRNIALDMKSCPACKAPIPR